MFLSIVLVGVIGFSAGEFCDFDDRMVVSSSQAYSNDFPLIYCFDSAANTTMIELATKEAISLWSSKTVARFWWSSRNCEIVIAMFSKNHGDGHPFDGPNGNLAHAFYRGNSKWSCDIHIDRDEAWSLGKTERHSYNLIYVIAHEIGHVLGLAHSNDNTSIMYYRYINREPGLNDDDIAAIGPINMASQCKISVVACILMFLPKMK
jgi:hypothetical protein